MSRTTQRLRRARAPAAAIAGLLCTAAPASAVSEKDPSAGGYPIDQELKLGAVIGVVTLLLFSLVLAREPGRLSRVVPIQRWSSRTIAGVPGWAAIPSAVVAIAMPVIWFGIYWDISIHIDHGRDDGIVPNPGHWLVLIGIFSIFAAGWLAVVMTRGRPGPAAVRITRDWYAPVSGIFLLLAASMILLQFPLDDIAHRLYGQDVTVFSATHLLLILGNSIATIAVMMLLVEGRLALRAGGKSPARHRSTVLASARVQTVLAGGALLVGFSLYQVEWDYGVPQWRLLLQAVLIAGVAGIVLVPIRILAGRGAALGAALVYVAVRGAITLLVSTDVVGIANSEPHFPLYIAEALVVELVALRVGTDRPYRLAIAAGAAIGTVCVAAEWGWSHAWSALPWPGHALDAAIAGALPAAVGGGLIGAFFAAALRRSARDTGRRGLAAVAVGVTLLAVVIADFTHQEVPDSRAAVTLDEARPAPEREVNATVRLDPADLAQGAEFATATAWQGGGRVRIVDLREVGEGVYRTAAPLPVHGKWKSWIRVARGDVLAAMPLFLPRDTGIPAPEVPASRRFERDFVPNVEIMQRERKQDVPGWLWGVSYLVMGGMTLMVLGLLGVGLRRLATADARDADREAQEPPRPAVPRERVQAGVA